MIFPCINRQSSFKGQQYPMRACILQADAVAGDSLDSAAAPQTSDEDSSAKKAIQALVVRFSRPVPKNVVRQAVAASESSRLVQLAHGEVALLPSPLCCY